MALRVLTFSEVEGLFEKRLEDSSAYIEKYRQTKYNHYVNSVHENEHGIKEVNTYEQWRETYKSRKVEYKEYLSANSYYEIAANYFYSKSCKFYFQQSNLLYRFYFDQFGKKHHDRTFDHNIILFNLLPFCSDKNEDKVNYFSRILSNLTSQITVESFTHYLRLYLENNIFEVLNRVASFSQVEEDELAYYNFLKENDSDLQNEINLFISEITAMYKLKDPSDEKVYLVDENDFAVIFKGKEFIFNYETMWKYFLEKAELKKRHYN